LQDAYGEKGTARCAAVLCGISIKHWEDNALQETISGARAFAGGRFDPSTIRTDEGSAVSFSAAAEVPSTPFPCAKPGFADVYAHLR